MGNCLPSLSGWHRHISAKVATSSDFRRVDSYSEVGNLCRGDNDCKVETVLSSTGNSSNNNDDGYNNSSSGKNYQELQFKYVMIGLPRTGKSRLLDFIKSLARSDSQQQRQQLCYCYQPTIGVDFYNYRVRHGRDRVKVQFWDTAGQKRFAMVTQAYLQVCHVVMLFCDLTADLITDQTVDQLTDQLTDRPADQLTDQLTDRPADQPTDSQPTESHAAASLDIWLREFKPCLCNIPSDAVWWLVAVDNGGTAAAAEQACVSPPTTPTTPTSV